MTDQTNLLRLANTSLLLVIALLLLLIFRALPNPSPTRAEFDAAKFNEDKLRSLRARLPVVSLNGAVEVFSDPAEPLVIQSDPTNPLWIEAGLAPLDVTISDSVEVRTDPKDPLDVTISR